jgi:hypothetical protein
MSLSMIAVGLLASTSRPGGRRTWIRWSRCGAIEVVGAASSSLETQSSRDVDSALSIIWIHTRLSEVVGGLENARPNERRLSMT